jgi:Spy/CpxP family protein refolding chaperone
MNEQNNRTGNSPQKKSNRKYVIAAAIIGLGLTGAVGAQAFAESKTFQHMTTAAKWHGGWHGGGRHGGWRHSNMSAEEMDKHVERMVKHLAIEIDATDAQQERLITLAKSLAADVMPVRKDMHDTGEQIGKILTAPTVDRAALETLRAERFAQVETISKNLTNALADAAEVLTAEQRRIVAERIEQFRGMRARWHRG